ncbi:UNVERIFIED_CONTAM: Thaumatin-like protein 1 [Sesamum calycinum]|uniref:Thaumatin-like protein 1 n=1 Tax=Sesamum calycinum TaxID=2727403 RepID=A0AAW2R7T8_9LAMI
MRPHGMARYSSQRGSPTLGSTGFELPQDSSRTFVAPAGWSGRFWAELDVNSPTNLVLARQETAGRPRRWIQSAHDSRNHGRYGHVRFDRLRDGSEPGLPSELRVRGGAACQSACEAFGSPEYCCSGAFNSPTSCRPSVYSQMFKSACPRSYSYAYDDPTSTFTCSGADYTVTFCPSMPSQKSSKDPTPTTTTTGEPNAETSLSGTTATTTTTGATNAETSLPGTDTTPMAGSESGPGLGVTGSNPEPDFGSGSQAMLADGSWMADMAMGGSARVYCPSALRAAGFIASTLLILSIFS